MGLIEALQANTALFVLACVVVGLMVGSFLNVVIHRLPLMMERDWRTQCAEICDCGPGATEPERLNLLVPRSRCPACGHVITAVENIPVVSYVLQRGRCTGCGARISVQYPLVEAFTGLLTGVVAWHFGFGVPAIAAIALTWALIALAVIDFRTQLLPDSITLPLVWLGLVLALFEVFVDLRTSVIGAVAGYMSLWLVYQGFRLLTGKEGMGYGDFKLLAALGAWMGWQALLPIVLVSSIVGAVLGVGLIAVAGRDRGVPMPFGPFLAMAGWIVLMWGGWIQGLLW